MRAFELTDKSYGEITSGIRRYGKSDALSFYVLRHATPKPNLPLAIIVHPGDLIAGVYGLSPEDRKKVMAFSFRNQGGTAADIRKWRELPAEVLVLNRQSCELFMGQEKFAVSRDLADEMKKAWRSDTILFGDDLVKASEWMIANMSLEQRPHIYLAGAYSDPEYGCLTFIGQALEKVVGHDKITVSDHSPPGEGPGKAWRPGGQIVDQAASDK